MFSNDALSLVSPSGLLQLLWPAPNPGCLSYPLVAITPFVIIPTHDLHQVAVDHLSRFPINDGCAGIFIMSEDTKKHHLLRI
jgi:hypothetical protein